MGFDRRVKRIEGVLLFNWTLLSLANQQKCELKSELKSVRHKKKACTITRPPYPPPRGGYGEIDMMLVCQGEQGPVEECTTWG